MGLTRDSPSVCCVSPLLLPLSSSVVLSQTESHGRRARQPLGVGSWRRLVMERDRSMPKPSLIALIVIGLGSVSLCDAQEVGFIRIFDGKTLNGWSAPDMRYWSVEEGAITGRATREHPNTKSRWLVWQGGEVGDFELKLKFRIYGTVEANSGVQFRTVFSSENTHASGYQADLVRDPVWMGLIYDEGTGRKVLTHRGDRTVID